MRHIRVSLLLWSLSTFPICVEILPSSNPRAEMLGTAQKPGKRELYFKAGASEFWLCNENGRMRFFSRGAEYPDILALEMTVAKSLMSLDYQQCQETRPDPESKGVGNAIGRGLDHEAPMGSHGNGAIPRPPACPFTDRLSPPRRPNSKRANHRVVNR